MLPGEEGPAPTDVQRAFDKQERFLADNLQHASVDTSKPAIDRHLKTGHHT